MLSHLPPSQLFLFRFRLFGDSGRSQQNKQNTGILLWSWYANVGKYLHNQQRHWISGQHSCLTGAGPYISLGFACSPWACVGFSVCMQPTYWNSPVSGHGGSTGLELESDPGHHIIGCPQARCSEIISQSCTWIKCMWQVKTSSPSSSPLHPTN